MAKSKRLVVGSVVKGKTVDGVKKPDYIKMRDGTYLNLESPKQQLASMEKALSEGKLSEEVAEKIRERIAKIPEWVMFEVIQVVKE